MYCTISDIIRDVTEKTLRELTDDSDVPVNYNTTLIESKIMEASHYIDGYLVERYPLP
ncbi:MAG: phage protein Gp36 family protein, partial [Fervidobacterium pennivorans]